MVKLISNEIDLDAIVGFQRYMDDMYDATKYLESLVTYQIEWFWNMDSNIIKSDRIAYNGRPIFEVIIF